MSKELVVNELSLYPPCLDRTTAMARMQKFLLLLSKLKAHSRGASISIRTTTPLNEWMLAPDYAVKQWRNDGSVDRELRRKLQVIQFNWPAASEPELSSRQLGIECFCHGQRAEGLGLAWLLDGLAVGFDQQPWTTSEIELIEQTLGPDGMLVERQVCVRHASCEHHADYHASWLRPSLDVADGAELWSRRSTLFPALVFCSRIESQLDALDRGHPLLTQIVDRLQRLDEYATRWQAGPFDRQALGIKVTPESEPTLSQYRSEHTFLCPDGEHRMFSLHARLTPDAWRLFFHPLQPGQLVIGHIGEKLPNVSY